MQTARPIPTKGEKWLGNEEENLVVRENDNGGHIKSLSNERMKRKQSRV